VTRLVATLVAVAVGLASVGAGVAAWHLAQDTEPPWPEISAYSHGQLTRVGPFFYCDVLNLDDCQTPQDQGELLVNDRNPVQLSVPRVIGGAPWRLLRVYENPAHSTVNHFKRDSRLAVTIPTVDPQRGRLAGLVVQLRTLVIDESGELRDIPHAEWSVWMVRA